LTQACIAVMFSGLSYGITAGRTKAVFKQITITGTVTSTTGETLSGVSILFKGTTTGTTTDVDGKYSLTLADATGTLVFNYLGYETQEVDISGRTRIDVILKGAEKSLNEVVVIGYQTVQRKDVTGAISVISPQNQTGSPVVRLAKRYRAYLRA
jgi:hypothetical protein